MSAKPVGLDPHRVARYIHHHPAIAQGTLRTAEARAGQVVRGLIIISHQAGLSKDGVATQVAMVLQNLREVVRCLESLDHD